MEKSRWKSFHSEDKGPVENHTKSPSGTSHAQTCMVCRGEAEGAFLES
jgi:hypothetical protein